MPEDSGESIPLADRLKRRIEAEGPITFAEFMEAALYDPSEGFYSGLRVGEQGDFVTSPHLSPVFGELVARQVQEFWELLGRPEPFSVVEVGAGDGTLAGQVLASIAEPARSALTYIAVERSAAARSAMESRGDLDIGVVASLEEVEGGRVGCLLANEVMDNLPFHRVRRGDRGIVELFVGVEDGRFALVEDHPSSEEISGLAPNLGPGDEAVVSPAAIDLLDHAARVLRTGYVLLVDYGFTTSEEAGSVHAYREQRLEDDVLSEPGSKDITAGVDFPMLARLSRDRGLAVWGPVTQRDVLLALGFREWDQAAQARQQEAIAARRGIEALRIYSDRTRANLLIGRSGLGAFYVLCLGVGTTRPPRLAGASGSTRIS
jgi:SAM-dependent MidA family methyltransferase